MIQINLLPGAKRSKGRGGSGPGLAAIGQRMVASVKDPYLAGAVASVLLAMLTVGGLHWRQTTHAAQLAELEQQAVQDSTRYSAILKEKTRAEAQRDSILRQLDIIRSIDNDRYVWPHLMEEVSRALPPYTWLTSLEQTSEVVSVAAIVPVKDDAKGAKKGAKADTAAAKAADADFVPPPMRFRIVGQTVDIQALTRFMKMLEASAFVQNVQLGRTSPVLVDGKDVTEFQLDCEFEQPDRSVLQLIPVSLAVR